MNQEMNKPRECLICGSIELDHLENGTIKCKHCGYVDYEKYETNFKLDLYIAEEYLKKNDFFEAKERYQEFIKKYRDNQDECSKMHFKLFLCEYFIQYITDPTTKEQRAICHCYNEINALENYNFREALRLATDENKEVFQQQAKEIERIRKDIEKAVKNITNEYDIFICYKGNTFVDEERDQNNGKETEDCILARYLYKNLYKKYRVFFAKETLKKEKVENYEANIYAALRSSKIMFLMCSQDNYINWPFVKSEWYRYKTWGGNREIRPICGNKVNKYDEAKLGQFKLEGCQAIKYESDDQVLKAMIDIIENRIERTIQTQIFTNRERIYAPTTINIENKVSELKTRSVFSFLGVLLSLFIMFFFIETLRTDYIFNTSIMNNQYIRIVGIVTGLVCTALFFYTIIKFPNNKKLNNYVESILYKKTYITMIKEIESMIKNKSQTSFVGCSSKEVISSLEELKKTIITKKYKKIMNKDNNVIWSTAYNNLNDITRNIISNDVKREVIIKLMDTSKLINNI